MTWNTGGGGTGVWVEHDLDPGLSNWTDDGQGTWSEAGGVISQTNATANSAMKYNTGFASPDYAIEADVRIPSGQNAGTTVMAMVSAGCPDQIAAGTTGLGALDGEGIGLGAAAAGDGQAINAVIDVNFTIVPDPTGPTAWPTAVAQDEWHTIRGIVSPSRQSFYLDGVYLFSSMTVNSGSDAAHGSGQFGSIDLAMICAVGLVDFRNIKVWTRPLPA